MSAFALAATLAAQETDSVAIAAFTRSCAQCHASRDGADLAHFSFPDTTIVRRAVEHVESATARRIAAYITSLRPDRIERGTRLFQPGGTVLENDEAFARSLWGGDRWPAELTSDSLRGLDPRRVPIAIPLPIWSDEATEQDWMPERPLPPALLDAAGGRVRLQLERYYQTRAAEDLRRAVAAVQQADRTATNAPICRLENHVPDPDFVACFELRRWLAALVAQHMIRSGSEQPLDPALHNSWWLVGDVFRRARRRATLGDDDLNRAAWFYLSFMFAPGRQTTAYTVPAFVALDLPRHATWVALRSAVAQPAGRTQAYRDVAIAARHAPAHWTRDVVTFGFRHLSERLAAGDAPEDPAAAARAVDDALLQARRRLARGGTDDYASLAALGSRLKATLRVSLSEVPERRRR